MGIRGTSVGLLAVAALIAGCGSSSNTTSAGTSSAGTTTSGGTASTASTGGSSFGNAQNCQQLAGLGAKLTQAVQAASRGGKVNLQAEVSAIQSLANSAPPAIRPDLQITAQTFASFAAAISKAGYTIGSVPTAAQLGALQSAVLVFSQPKFRLASHRVSVWVRQNCG